WKSGAGGTRHRSDFDGRNGEEPGLEYRLQAAVGEKPPQGGTTNAAAEPCGCAGACRRRAGRVRIRTVSGGAGEPPVGRNARRPPFFPAKRSADDRPPPATPFPPRP